MAFTGEGQFASILLVIVDPELSCIVNVLQTAT
jgi:hypothetical protein